MNRRELLKFGLALPLIPLCGATFAEEKVLNFNLLYTPNKDRYSSADVIYDNRVDKYQCCQKRQNGDAGSWTKIILSDICQCNSEITSKPYTIIYGISDYLPVYTLCNQIMHIRYGTKGRQWTFKLDKLIKSTRTDSSDKILKDHFRTMRTIDIPPNMSRDQINKLGRRAPYHRFVNFPIEITAKVEKI